MLLIFPKLLSLLLKCTSWVLVSKIVIDSIIMSLKKVRIDKKSKICEVVTSKSLKILVPKLIEKDSTLVQAIKVRF